MGLPCSMAEESHTPGWWSSPEPPIPFVQPERALLWAWVRQPPRRIAGTQIAPGSPETLSFRQAAFDILLFLHIVISDDSVSGLFNSGPFEHRGAGAPNKVD